MYVRLKADPQEPLDTNYGITYASEEMPTQTSDVRVVLCEDNDDNKADVCLIANTVDSRSVRLRWKPRPNSTVGASYEIWRHTSPPKADDTTGDPATGMLIINFIYSWYVRTIKHLCFFKKLAVI